MKKKTIILLVVLGVIIIGAISAFRYGTSVYNSMVSAEEGVKAQWSNVENQYQRRADLIPNLVNTVKGYAGHEETTLQSVIEARAKATQVTVSADDLNAETLQKYQAAQGELSQALGRLLAVTENYPDLKANQNFLELQAQLEGTENRIATERTRYKDKAEEYNKMIRRFPDNIIANMTGFEAKPYFEADKEAAKAPKVEF